MNMYVMNCVSGKKETGNCLISVTKHQVCFVNLHHMFRKGSLSLVSP